MVGTNYIVKNTKKFSKRYVKNFVWKVLTVTKYHKKIEKISISYDVNNHVYSGLNV